MKISDFDYDLPPALIAQTPLEPRDSSRLLVLNRGRGSLEHRGFRDIGKYLRPGDLLIANQSRVIPARLLGRRAETGGAVEVLLLAERTDMGSDYWETLVRPGRRMREGTRLVFRHEAFPNMALNAEVRERTEAGGRIVHFSPATTQSLTVRQLIEQLGRMPLPPYIHETLTDPERYQTVYARISGSAAAPTAGLHFTPGLLEQLRQQGARIGFVTLHVGLDTFRPVECEDVSEHKMHSEEIELDAPTAELINETRKAGGRVIAVGTTSVRVLESVAGIYDGRITAYQGPTRLFITPGYRFQVVDAMITNFHLPRSTLLLLVSAFASKALIERAYQEAIREHYRFFSFGDAMLIF
jgi:S-adenosylmethionine:tRNA ribosyltransferase-isomerase